LKLFNGVNLFLITSRPRLSRREDWQFNFIVSEAPHTKTVSLIVVVHVAVATVEVQVPAVGTAVLRTTPVVAVAASVVQRAIAVVEVASGISIQAY